jgi:hypothetical protein
MQGKMAMAEYGGASPHDEVRDREEELGRAARGRRTVALCGGWPGAAMKENGMV